MYNLDIFTPERILIEVQALQYLFRLKNEIRYAQTRTQDDSTESVAEHIYGMHICASYFLPLEDQEHAWNRTHIYEMITLHDIDEIETGDVIGYTKTDAMRAAEADAMRVVMHKSPEHMQSDMQRAIDEYDAQTTVEARFVKAIDKFEPLIQTYNQKGKNIYHTNNTTAENASSIKEPHIKDFPFMYTFYKEIHGRMVDEDYFVT